MYCFLKGYGIDLLNDYVTSNGGWVLLFKADEFFLRNNDAIVHFIPLFYNKRDGLFVDAEKSICDGEFDVCVGRFSMEAAYLNVEVLDTSYASDDIRGTCCIKSSMGFDTSTVNAFSCIDYDRYVDCFCEEYPEFALHLKNANELDFDFSNVGVVSKEHGVVQWVGKGASTNVYDIFRYNDDIPIDFYGEHIVKNDFVILSKVGCFGTILEAKVVGKDKTLTRIFRNNLKRKSKKYLRVRNNVPYYYDFVLKDTYVGESHISFKVAPLSDNMPVERFNDIVNEVLVMGECSQYNKNLLFNVYSFADKLNENFDYADMFAHCTVVKPNAFHCTDDEIDEAEPTFVPKHSMELPFKSQRNANDVMDDDTHKVNNERHYFGRIIGNTFATEYSRYATFMILVQENRYGFSQAAVHDTQGMRNSVKLCTE